MLGSVEQHSKALFAKDTRRPCCFNSLNFDKASSIVRIANIVAGSMFVPGLNTGLVLFVLGKNGGDNTGVPRVERRVVVHKGTHKCIYVGVGHRQWRRLRLAVPIQVHQLQKTHDRWTFACPKPALQDSLELTNIQTTVRKPVSLLCVHYR